jgi:hypothetical protein
MSRASARCAVSLADLLLTLPAWRAEDRRDAITTGKAD